MRKYLVTGAAGFLGSAVCRHLIDRGEKVRAFDIPHQKGSDYLKELSSEVEIIEGDLRNKEDVARFFDVPAEYSICVIHCASIVAIDEEYNQKIMDVNVGGTKNIIEACLNAGNFERLVYVSSTGAIPELPKGQKIKEVSVFEPEKTPKLVRGCYSQSKALASQAVLDAVHNNNLNAVIVHPSGILGPRDTSLGEVSSTLIKIIKGKMPMGISGSFNLCDVRDLADGCLFAMDKGRTGECYILGNEQVQFKDFAKMITDICGGKPIRFFLPVKMAYFVAKQIEKRAKRKGEKPVMTEFSVYNLDRNNDFDSTKARTELGYKTRPYQETLRDEFEWMKKYGII